MGAESFFRIPVLGSFLRLLGGFPVERELSDRAALKAAQSLLESGDSLVLFPEGTRMSGPIIGDIKEGAAFLACRAGVPIIPVGLGGTERAFPKGGWWVRPSKVGIIVGDPIMPPNAGSDRRAKRSEVAAMSNEVRDSLQELFDRAGLLVGK